MLVAVLSATTNANKPSDSDQSYFNEVWNIGGAALDRQSIENGQFNHEKWNYWDYTRYQYVYFH